MKHLRILAALFGSSQIFGETNRMRRSACLLSTLLRWCFAVFAIIGASAQAQAQVPTISVTRTPTPMVAGQSYTVKWSSTGATEVSYNCTASGTGFAGNATLDANGSTTAVADPAWVGYPSTCVWTATGPGGSKTYNETMSTSAALNNAALLSQVAPPTLLAGQSYTVKVSIKNTGNTTWTTADGYQLGSQNPQDNSNWGVSRVSLPASVAPGLRVDFIFNVTAPTAPGTYNFQWRMLKDGAEWFGAPSTNVAVTVNLPVPTISVTRTPSPMISGQSYTLTWSSTNATSVSYNCTSTGTGLASAATLDASGSTTAVADPAWVGYPSTCVWTATGQGGSTKYIETVTTYDQGDSAQFVSQSVAASMITGSAYAVSVTMKNTGTTTWTTANSYKLGTQNPQDNTTWGVSRINLPYSVAPGQQVIFTFNVAAPATAGSYNAQWKMTRDGVGWFGAASPNVAVAVSPPAPTISVTRTPTPMIAGQSYTVKWSSTGATEVSYNCTASGTGFAGNTTLAASGSTTAVADPTWVGYPSTCVWTATGPGGSKTYNETMSTSAVLNNAAFVSQLVPATMIAGQSYGVQVLMRNTGNTTWTTADGYQLGSQNPQDNSAWGISRVSLPASVAPGAIANVTFNVTAPAAPGTHNFQWKMLKDGAEWFGAPSTNAAVTVNLPVPTITVTRTPSPMTAGQNYTVTWSSTNATSVSYNCTSTGTGLAGTATLDANGSTAAVADPAWVGYPSTCVWTATGQGGSKTYNETLTTLPANSASFVSQGVLATMLTGQSSVFSVTMKNTGTATWTAAAGYQLGSQNPQDSSTWGASRINLPASVSVAPGQTYTFTVPVTAPAAFGTYNFQWKMIQGAGGWFGAPSTNAVVTVNLPVPIITVTRTPSPMTAGQSYTLNWSSTNATSVAYNCTSSGTGFAGSATLDANGSTTAVADPAWVGYPSTCVWTATGQGGSKTYNETLTTMLANNAAFVSQLVPATMIAGQSYGVQVLMRNTGTATWTAAAGYQLGSQNPQDNSTWGISRVSLPASVAPGAIANVTFNVTAPAAPGTHNFQWKMLKDGAEWFGAPSTNVAVTVNLPVPTITVTRTPSPMTAGQSYTLSWSSTNATSVSYNCTSTGTGFAGSATLDVNGSTAAVADPAWVGYPSTCVWTATGQGGSKTYNETLTTLPANNASFVSQSVLATTMLTGQSSVFSVTMKNTGTATWTAAAGYQLGSQNPQDSSTWGASRINLPAAASVAPGQTYTFTVPVTAPAAFGTYNFQWKMIQGAGGWFGAPSTNAVVTVNLPVPTITVTRTPSPMMAGQSYTLNWNSTNATSVAYNCTSSGTGFAGSATLDANGSTTAVADPAWVGYQSTCVWTATGQGGSKTYNETLTTYNQGNSAQFMSQVVPAAMLAGQSYIVSVTMKNIGTTTWTAASGYKLGSQNPQDNSNWTATGRALLDSKTSVAPGAQTTFSFTVTAPATVGTSNFQWQMLQDGVGSFGAPSANVAVTVNPPVPTITVTRTPSPMIGGQSYTLNWSSTYATSVAYSCTSTGTGFAGSATLDPVGSTTAVADPAWAGYPSTCVWTATGPGGIKTYNETLTTVPANNAVFNSQSVPATMVTGQSYIVSVYMNNTGKTTWTAAAGYQLGSQNPQDNATWGIGRINLPAAASVAPGQVATFTFNVTAPATIGTYNFQWKMLKDGVEWFGASAANVAVTVNLPVPTITVTRTPSPMMAGQSYTLNWSSTNATSVAYNCTSSGTGFAGSATLDPTGSATAVADPAWVGHPSTCVWTATGQGGSKTYNETLTTYNQGNSAQFVSQVAPAAMLAGQPYNVSVTMKNIGTTTWTAASGYKLGSQNPQDNSTWGASRINLPAAASVAPGQTYAFTLPITAPAAPGAYNFQWQMLQDGVGSFGAPSANVAVTVNPPVPTITVTRTPSPMIGGQNYTLNWSSTYATSMAYSCTSTGTGFVGSATLDPIGSAKAVADAAWIGYPSTCVWTATGPGGIKTYNETMTTSAAVSNASFVSQSVPTPMIAGQSYNVSVTMQNTGSTTWTPVDGYQLGSQNPQGNSTWGASRVNLPVNASIEPGQQTVFTFNVTAPTTAGTYNFQWKMIQGSSGWFGATSTNLAVVVSPLPPPISAPPTIATRTSAFQYDAANGLLTKEIVEPGDAQLRLETAYAYDAWGNKTSATVSSPATGLPAIVARISSTAYDARGQFPTSSTNALGQSESKTVEPKFGALTSLTGPNGLTTQWQYDSFGRKTLEIRADGTRTKWSYLYCNGVNGGAATCPSLAKYLVQVTPLASDGVTANGPWSKTYFDALDREVSSETLGFDGASVITVSTEYDSLGHVYRSSRPYYSGQTPQWTTQSYDGLDRAVTTTAPDNTQTSVLYNGLTTSVTNALGQTQTKLKNSQGKLAKVTDAAGNVISYQYDAFGNLWKTTDPKGNIVTLAYDIRGRKTQMVDPDMGKWTYAYNVLGELMTQTNANGQIANMAYDKLGRMTSRSEPDLVSTWTYDNCAKGVGKLCQASADNGYISTPGYDSLGRASSTTTTIDTAYTASVTFDANGRVATQTYPTGFAVKYVYTPLGYLKEVRNNASNALYWSANTRDAEGHLLQQTYGNNVITQQVYEATTGRLKNSYAGAGNGVQNLAYSYDGIGNLLSRNDANQNLSETFLYDTLNRVTSSTVNSSGAGVVMQTYAYDGIGNITSRSGVGTYTYGPINARPHGITQIALGSGGKRTYSYDANGSVTQEIEYDAANNVVTSKGRTEAYTSFAMPQTLNAPGISLAFAYGPEHQRIKQIAPSATTIYLHPDNAGGMFYEKDIKAGGSIEHKHFITAGGQVIAVAKQAGGVTTVSYFHRDQLGSTTAMTNEAGAVIERLAYEPFGKRRFPAGSVDASNAIVGVNTDRGFTNHEHLDELGLIHMNGRIYDPATGRFMSADPLIQAPDNLQSYNRYAYVWNNPLNLTDPTGFSAKSDKIAKLVASVVAAYFVGPWVANAFYSAAAGAAAASAGAAGATLTTAQVAGMWTTAQIVGGAAGGFAAGLVGSGGDLKAGAVGAVSGGLFGWAGGVTPGNPASVERYGAHALAGCASGEMGGGGCARGAASAVAGQWATNATNGNFVASVVAGGTVSVIGGGKFENGAMTAAFGYLFNHMLHPDIQRGTCTTPSNACAQQNAEYRAAYDAQAKGQAIEPVIVEDILIGGVGSARGVAAGAAESFFNGTRYSERVLGQMKSGDFHGFSRAVEAFAGSGEVSLVVQPSTGVVKQMLQIPGSYVGREGIFEFIKHESGVIYHRLFKPK